MRIFHLPSLILRYTILLMFFVRSALHWFIRRSAHR
jgi:hypothetical protein